MIDWNNPGFRMKENMIVTTLFEYLETAKGDTLTEEEYEDFLETNFEESELLREIIAIEVAIYIMRRTNCLCASNIDAMRQMAREKERAYNGTFNKAYLDFNKDIAW